MWESPVLSLFPLDLLTDLPFSFFFVGEGQLIFLSLSHIITILEKAKVDEP